MKNTKLVTFLWLVLVGAVVLAVNGVRGAEAKRSDTFRTDINPALLYYQAFLVGPNLDPADNTYLLNTDWRNQKLPERFGELVAKYDAQFGLVRRASHATVPCDWGTDMSAGPATLLPHLARAKALAQTARLRALWALRQGRPADACDDLIAAVALGRNLSRDGFVISELVQNAIEAIICSTVAENLGRFSPETLKQLVDGFDSSPPRGTLEACIRAETAFGPDWTLRKLLELQKQHPGNDAEVMAGMRQIYRNLEGSEPGETYWGRVTQAAGGTSDGVKRLLEGRQQMYERLAVLLKLPYREYESRVKDFSAEVEKSANPFVSATLPSCTRARSREFRIMVEQAMVRAAVVYKLRGEEALKSVADPCGDGAFAFRRFMFEGIDRGFELKSAYANEGVHYALIFVENDGPAFYVEGPKLGQPVQTTDEQDAFRRRYGIESRKK
jgi:hypothetical protein